MRHLTTVERTVHDEEVLAVTCDKCGKRVDISDIFEIQEFHEICFTGGYGSVFGDTYHVNADICQRCLLEFLKSCPGWYDRHCEQQDIFDVE